MFTSQKQLWLRLNNRKTYVRILIYFVSISICAMTISTIVLYSFFSRAVIQAIGGDTETLLEQRAASSSSLMEWTNDYAQQWAQSPEIVQAALQNYYEQYESFQVVNKLKDLIANHPFLESVYVVNDYNHKIHDTRGGTFDINEFYDHEVLKLIEDWDSPFSQKLVPRDLNVTVNGLNLHVPLLSLIIRYEMNSTLSSVVFNIDSNKLQSFWGQKLSTTKGSFYLVDEYGMVLSSSNPEFFLKAFPSKPQIERMTSAHGWFTDASEQAGKKVVVYTQFSWSGYTNWKMIQVIDENQILGQVHQLRNLTFLFYIVIFGLTVYSVWRFSNKIYSPIEELMSDVNETTSGQLYEGRRENTDEVSMLSSVFNRQKLQITRLSDYWRDNRANTKEQILRELLLQRALFLRNEAQQLFEHNEIALTTDSLIVVVFRLDGYDEFTRKYPSGKDQKLIRYAITNIVKEVLSERSFTESLDIGTDHIAAICQIEDEEAISDLLPYLQICQNQISNFLDISVTVAISSYIEDFSDLHDAYLSTYELTNERFKHGYSSILHKLAEVSPTVELEYAYPVDIESKVLQAIKQGQEEEAIRQLAIFVDHISDFPYSDCRLAMIQFTMTFAKLLRKMHIEPEQANFWTFTSAHQKIDQLENLTGVQHWLSLLCVESIRILQAKQLVTKNSHFIPEVTLLVDQNLQNPNLCSKFIAEQMGMSLNYLRTVFKEETTRSLSEYITEKRLEKTSALLVSTEMSVEEISEQFGFSSLHSFYYAFKKKFGVPPAQYRRSGG